MTEFTCARDTAQAAQRIKLDTLPTDILEDIMDYLPSDLARCALVNKTFHAMAQPMLNGSADLTQNSINGFHRMLMSKTSEARCERLAAVQNLGLYDSVMDPWYQSQIDLLIQHLSSMQLVSLNFELLRNDRHITSKLVAAIPTGTIRHLCLFLEDEGGEWMDLLFSLSSTLQSLQIVDLDSSDVGMRKSLPGFQAPIFSVLNTLKVRSWLDPDDKWPSLLLAIAKEAPNLRTLKVDGLTSERLLLLLKHCASKLHTLGLCSDASVDIDRMTSVNWNETCPNLSTLNLRGELERSDARKILSRLPSTSGLKIDRLDRKNLRDVIEDLQSGCACFKRLEVFHAIIVMPDMEAAKDMEALDEIERLIVEIETSIKNLRTVCEEQKVTLVIERVVHDMDWELDRICGSSSIRNLF